MRPMSKVWLRCAVGAMVLLPLAAASEPIRLKLSFFSSDREAMYRGVIQPFIQAVNGDPAGNIQIEPYPSGKLGRDPKLQAQMVLDDAADMAFVITSLSPERFPDTAAIELPGLFRDVWEASFVHTRLALSGLLRGYDDFVVVAAISTGSLNVHVRAPAAALDDLRGRRIRASNLTGSLVLKALGMIPEFLPINQTAEAISRDTIDGATAVPEGAVDFGIARVTSFHYLIGTGGVPFLVLMNKEKFAALPPSAQETIRKYGGEWLAARYVETYNAGSARVLEQWKSDPKRKVIFPSAADDQAAQVAFQTVIDEWLTKDSRNRQLLDAIKAETDKLRSVR